VLIEQTTKLNTEATGAEVLTLNKVRGLKKSPKNGADRRASMPTKSPLKSRSPMRSQPIVQEPKLLKYFGETVKLDKNLRPKKVSISQFIKIIEEIYTAKYKNDMNIMEEEIIKKTNDKSIAEQKFAEFILDFFNKKFRKNAMLVT
jgi:hypothetical protein